MRRLHRWLRYHFFETFGQRASLKTYVGHGDFTEVNGWLFRGRVYEC